MNALRGCKAVYKRELRQYFDTPLAYVLSVAFLLLAGMFSFYLGNFYDGGQANLDGFFRWHPWLFLFFIPAVSMRLWAEETRQGTSELLLTLPVSTAEAIAGKFFAAWTFVVATVAGTFPIWMTVNYLGDPDNGRIVAGYLGSALMAGAYLGIGLAVSAATRNQVVAFVVTAVICFLFIASGYPMVLDFFSAAGAPQPLLDTISYFSFITQFQEMTEGLIGLTHLSYFGSLALFWLAVNYLLLRQRHA
ncbi:MAG: ABC transporter permease subunit [Rickettsiales bacterium]